MRFITKNKSSKQLLNLFSACENREFMRESFQIMLREN